MCQVLQTLYVCKEKINVLRTLSNENKLQQIIDYKTISTFY